MTVASLPSRRINRTDKALWEQLELEVTCGFDGEHRVREVFAARRKTDRGIDATLADISVLISHLLQNGFTAPELLQKLTTMPPAESAAPASLVGVIVRAAVIAEEQRREELRLVGVHPREAAD